MSAPFDPLVLSDDALAALGIGPGEIADAIEAAIGAQEQGLLHTAAKSSVWPGEGRYVMSTLATGDAPEFTVLKAVMVQPKNPARGLPSINGAIMVLDSDTGLVRALLGANWITAARTAALSVVAARRLANPGAGTIAFIGCGVQARSHLDAFADGWPLARVLACGRGQANVDLLLEEARGLGLEGAAATPEEALAEADIIVSAVTLNRDLSPFADARWMKPGAFAAITDVARPWVPDGQSAFDAVIIDDRAQEDAQSLKLVDPALVSGDLADLVSGRTAAAFDPARRTAFIFRGQALADFALAALVMERAAPA